MKKWYINSKTSNELNLRVLDFLILGLLKSNQYTSKLCNAKL